MTIRGCIIHLVVRGKFGQHTLKNTAEPSVTSSLVDERPTATRIPSEILEQIWNCVLIDHPAQDEDAFESIVGRSVDEKAIREYQQAIANLSLVCHHWHDVAAAYVPRAFVLFNSEHVQRLKHAVHLQRHPQKPGSFIHSLAILGSASDELGLILLSVASYLTQLRTLIWDTSKEPPPGENKDSLPPAVFQALPRLFQSFEYLQYLALRRQTFESFRRVTRIVCALPRILDLEMTDVDWPLGPQPPSVSCCSQRLLRVRYAHTAETRERCGTSLVWLLVHSGRTRALRAQASTHRIRQPLTGEDARTVHEIVLLFAQSFDEKRLVITTEENDKQRTCESPILTSEL